MRKRHIPSDRRPWTTRLISAVRRRVQYAASQLAPGDHATAAYRAFGRLTSEHGIERLLAHVGLLAGVLETVVAYGETGIARRWGSELLMRQHADGSFSKGELVPVLRNTALAVDGLLSTVLLLPDVDRPRILDGAKRACDFLSFRLGQAEQTMRAGLTVTDLACLRSLSKAGRHFDEPTWRETVEKLLPNWNQGPAVTDARLSTLELTWLCEILADMDLQVAAREVVACLADRQRPEGALRAAVGSRVVSCHATAQAAVCWYRFGDRERADRAMRWLVRRQRRNGAWPRDSVHWEPFADYDESSLWTQKYYLDAARLQVRIAFDTTWASFPPRIDPSDGRAVAVVRWFEQLGPDARIVDVGCGRGRFLRLLRSTFAGARLTGVDISRAMLEELPDGVQAVKGGLLSVPVQDGAFDGALAVESLEHCLLPDRAVDELARVVRPGGSILIIDKDRARHPFSEHDPWEQWFSAKQLADWLSKSCDRVVVEHVAHAEGLGGKRLFLAASGRRRLV